MTRRLSNAMTEILNSCLNGVHQWFPRRCLLCAAETASGHTDSSANTPVCAGCNADLPRLPVRRCVVCAIPLPAGPICGACLKKPPRFARVSAAFLYRYPADALIRAFKYGGNLALAAPFAHWLADTLAERADVVIPMPLTPARLRERGFNQAHEIACRLARRTGIALEAEACRRVLDTAPQAILPWPARARNVRGAFVCDADLSGMTVAVVDDVMTTGATINELARTLRRAGAAQVSAWVIARAVRRDYLASRPG